MVLPRPTELPGGASRLWLSLASLHTPPARAARLVAPAAAAAQARRPPSAAARARPLSSSAAPRKKTKATPPPASPSSSSSAAAAAGSPGAPDDPLDVEAALAAAWAPVDADFRAQLHALVAGGRFDASGIGALAVAVPVQGGSGSGSGSGSGGKKATQTFPLRELAQVVPRAGRAVSLLVNDAAYVKPIMSAVQASRDFNQQPQRAPGNDLELLLRVEPARRDDLRRRLRDLVQARRDALRRARAAHDRRLRDARRAGRLLPDDAHRADRELQRLQDRKMKEVDADEAAALAQLTRG